MMDILLHRNNAIEKINGKFGAEIDIRDFNGKLVLSHSYPTDKSTTLENYLQSFPRNSLLAINVKSCEIEKDLKEILESFDHKKYFVFDFSFPYLRKALELGLSCAFRVSEYEKDIHPYCDWVWVDIFNGVWYDENYLKSLSNKGLKLALVSPELHGRTDEKEFKKIKELVEKKLVDALCTTNPTRW